MYRIGGCKMINQTRRSWERTYQLDIDHTAKAKLWKYIQHERQYHNTLVNELNSRLRVMSGELLSIKDHHEKLWGAVAYSGIKLKTLVKKPVEEWPAELRPFANLIVHDGKIAISERMQMIYDVAATDAAIHPEMRRAIAMEILKWVQPQAKSINTMLTNSTGQLSTPIHMLQPLSVENKRHIQLLGHITDISYDEEQRVSTVHLPYADYDIKIKNQDLTKTPHDNIVIRQNPNNTPTDSWVMTVKEGNGRYQVDMVDVVHRVSRKKPAAKINKPVSVKR